MRATATLLTLLLLSACGGGEEAAPADDMADTPEAPAMSMADFAGTWNATSMLEGTADPVSSALEVSADGSEWRMILEGRDPVPVTVTMQGDSIITVTDSYESILREGVMVTVRTASVLQGGDRMVGVMTATYTTDEGVTVVTGTTESVRGGM